MADSEDKSTTFSSVEAISIVTAPADRPAAPYTSLVETDQATLPVATTLDAPPDFAPSSSAVNAIWGLSPRDGLLLLFLAIACLGLSVWHWGQLSGWGMEPVEVHRLPERVYDYRIDINKANWVEWTQLPGVGETLAQRILEYRERHGPFQGIDELDNVKGIGPKTVEKLRPWLTVQEANPE